MRDDWRTPPQVFEWAQSLVGAFDYDAACMLTNSLATPLWSVRIGGFTEQDSLSAPWPGDCKIWVNPPYSKIEPWIDAALNCDSLVALLIPSPNGEDRYARLLPRAHEFHIIGRLAFINGDTGKPRSGNERGSSLFLINTWGAGARTVISRDEVMRK